MYYPNNTLKHKLCLRGNQLLYEYAEARKIPHKKTGKYIVATNEKEITKLEKIYNLGCKNKVQLKRVSKDEIKVSCIYQLLEISQFRRRNTKTN